MARILSGDHGFSYRYVDGEQPSNLVHLARVSGAGETVLAATLELEGLTAVGQPRGELVRPLGPNTWLTRHELDAIEVARPGASGNIRVCNGIPTTTLDTLVQALVDQADILLDAARSAPFPTLSVSLVVQLGYALPRRDHHHLLGWLKAWAPDLSLASVAAPDEPPGARILRRTAGAEYLPWLGYQILRHALRTDARELAIHEPAAPWPAFLDALLPPPPLVGEDRAHWLLLAGDVAQGRATLATLDTPRSRRLWLDASAWFSGPRGVVEVSEQLLERRLPRRERGTILTRRAEALHVLGEDRSLDTLQGRP